MGRRRYAGGARVRKAEEDKILAELRARQTDVALLREENRDLAIPIAASATAIRNILALWDETVRA